MRIISGSARGRKLLAPGSRFGRLVRPTSDRAREALFNILGEAVPGARVLDLFAGTGALGLEALSRGAAQALFIEGDRAVAKMIDENIAVCGFADRGRVLIRDLAGRLSFLAGLRPVDGFSLVFLDPPYGKKFGHRLLPALAKSGILAPRALVIAEDRAGEEYPDHFGSLACYDQRRYGEAAFRLYRLEGSD